MNYIGSYKKNQNGYTPSATTKMHGMLFNNKIMARLEDEMDLLLNTDEAAELLRITPNALRILVHRARIQSYKFGHRLRFKLSDLMLVLQPKED